MFKQNIIQSSFHEHDTGDPGKFKYTKTKQDILWAYMELDVLGGGGCGTEKSLRHRKFALHTGPCCTQ